MNAKKEFIKVVADSKVTIECALIKHGLKKFPLIKGYNSVEYAEFLSSLDFEYDSGYGGQELFGTIWCTNNTWMDRREYDGSEWWEHRERPAIDPLVTDLPL